MLPSQSFKQGNTWVGDPRNPTVLALGGCQVDDDSELPDEEETDIVLELPVEELFELLLELLVTDTKVLLETLELLLISRSATDSAT